MEDSTSTIEMLYERAEQYTKTSIELLKLQTVDKTADVVSSLFSQIIVSVVFVVVCLLVNIGLSFWIGELLGKVYYGFFAVSGLYLILVIIVYKFRVSLLKTPIRDLIIVKMLNKN